MLESADAYYNAEIFALPFAMGLAVIMVLVGAFLIRREFMTHKPGTPRGFAGGLAYPIMIAGAMILVASVVYAFKLDAHRDFSAQLHKLDPASFREAELAHMSQVEDNFNKILFFDYAFVVFGAYLTLRGVVKKRNFRIGIGLGICVISALLCLVEWNNKARAQVYIERLKAERPQVQELPNVIEGEGDL